MLIKLIETARRTEADYFSVRHGINAVLSPFNNWRLIVITL